jgi:hypothetical protein
MEFDRNKHLDDWDDHSNKTADKPNAWRVEDDRNIKEKPGKKLIRQKRK